MRSPVAAPCSAARSTASSYDPASSTTVAPSAFIAPTRAARLRRSTGESPSAGPETKTVHGRPCSDATRATARPWFPAVAHTTPRLRCSAEASLRIRRRDRIPTSADGSRTGHPTILKAFNSKRALSSLTDTAPRPRDAASAGRLRSGVGDELRVRREVREHRRGSRRRRTGRGSSRSVWPWDSESRASGSS